MNIINNDGKLCGCGACMHGQPVLCEAEWCHEQDLEMEPEPTDDDRVKAHLESLIVVSDDDWQDEEEESDDAASIEDW